MGGAKAALGRGEQVGGLPWEGARLRGPLTGDGSGRLGGRGNQTCEACHGVRRTAELEVEGAIPVAGAGEGAEAWPVRLLAC